MKRTLILVCLGLAIALLPALSAFSSTIHLPVAGTITSGYGLRWGRMHHGIDISAPVGTPIHAVAEGMVAYAGTRSGYGLLVELRHLDGSMTRYAHNSRNRVQQGDYVIQGQAIAEVGCSGYCTGPHVHFEAHVADVGTVNPISYLSASRIVDAR